MKSNKVLAIVLALVLAAGCFAGCSEKASSEKFVIGGTGPLTGNVSSYGISVQQGAALAVEEINKAGGLNGHEFDFIMKDDKGEAEDAATGYDQLMDAGMQISIGSVTSGACESFASKSVEDNLFFITPSASAANVIADRPNAFRVCFGDPDQGTLAADTLVNDYGKSNIGVIYDTSDPYSSGIYDAFVEEMDALGASFSVKTFDAENNKDFSTQAEALKDCDVIFLPIYYTEAGLIARALAAKGCSSLVFGCDGLDGVADQIDETVTNEVQYITPFDVNASDSRIAAFVSAYTEKYNVQPDQFAADGYDAVYTIYEAMKAANISDVKIEASDLCNEVVKVLTGSSFSYAGVTGTMTWDASGACNKSAQIVKVQ